MATITEWMFLSWVSYGLAIKLFWKKAYTVWAKYAAMSEKIMCSNAWSYGSIHVRYIIFYILSLQKQQLLDNNLD